MEKPKHPKFTDATEYFAAQQSDRYPAPSDGTDQQLINAAMVYILTGTHNEILQLEAISTSHRVTIVRNTILYIKSNWLSEVIDPEIELRIEELLAILASADQK